MAVTVIDPPAALRAAQWSLRLMDSVAEPRSAYSFEEARLDFAGEIWALTVTTPPLRSADALAVLAWCDRLRDADAVARLFKPATVVMPGTVTASSVNIAANAAAGTRALTVSGLGAGKTIEAGALATHGGRLYRVRETVTGNVGSMTVTPRLRVPASIGDSLQLGALVAGRFRLQGRPAHALDAPRFGALVPPMALEFMEALGS